MVEQRDNGFNIKITAYREESYFAHILDGANYEFQSKNQGDPNWKVFMSVHHDDGLDLSDKNIRFFGPLCAFTFISDKYAVTLDAGRHWTTGSILRDDRSCLIDHISFQDDGTGQLFLNCSNRIQVRRVSNFGLEITD